MVIDNMVTDKLKQLTEYQTKIVELQNSIEQERKGALAHLHEEYGFNTPGELIKALREATSSKGIRKGRGGRRRKHARITPELREKIKVAIQSGKTGTQVAKEFGVSVPSIHNIKKEFGLVKSRKKK
jgi:DNA invertase Pin-like site-specific DNA recombinase